MGEQFAAVVQDTRLSSDARIVVLHVLSLGAGEHEVDYRLLSRLLNQAGEKRVRTAVADAVAEGWIVRTEGGKGHHPRFSFSPAQVADLSDSPAETADLKPDSPAKAAELKVISPTTTPTPPTERAGADEPEGEQRTAEPTVRADSLSLAKLRNLIAPHADAAEAMRTSAQHSATWPSEVTGYFRPPDGGSDGGGTRYAELAMILPDKERQARAIAVALAEYAGTGKVYQRKLFVGFVWNAARSIRDGPPEMKATGTDGGGFGRRGGKKTAPDSGHDYGQGTQEWRGFGDG